MTAYYNEINPHAAQWLRNLIAAGHIAPGIIDERSIEDVPASDLRGFVQCHFFAGIGIWSHALRAAGWPDNRPVWTGSCPCQPFSEAGKGAGFADERHLWPAWHYLIEQRRPAVVIGEQVAKKNAGPWLDLVQDDLEAMGYAVGAVPFPAASVGGFHIRERLYWCANAQQHDCGREAAATHHQGAQAIGPPDRPGGHSRVVDRSRAAPEWVLCGDGKRRPIEPGLSAVVDEYPGRVDRLRAYGNAIDATAASVFIECVMESL